MNAIERQKQTHRRNILTLAARIRFQGLDVGGEVTPEQDAQAAAMVAEHSEADIDEAMALAAVIGKLADPNCTSNCKGKGAAANTDDPVYPVYVVCECVRRAERDRRDAQPSFVATSMPPRDINVQVTVAEKVLADAKAAQTAACKNVDQTLTGLAGQLDSYKAEKQQLDDAIEKAKKGHLAISLRSERELNGLTERGAELERQLNLLRKQISDVMLRDTCELAEAHQAVLDRENALVCFEAGNRSLTVQQQELTAVREKIANRHAPKIERAEKRLKRLRFLRGDKLTADVDPDSRNTEATK
jgi:hypothetical protein